MSNVRREAVKKAIESLQLRQAQLADEKRAEPKEAELHMVAVAAFEKAIVVIDALPAAEDKRWENLRTWLAAEVDRLQCHGLRYGTAHAQKKAAILIQVIGQMDSLSSPPPSDGRANTP
jgi:hypothetical protein